MWGLWRREGTPEGFSLVLKKKSSASRCKITWIIPSTLFPLMLQLLGMVSTSTEIVTSIGMGQLDELVGWTPQALGSLWEISSLREEGGWRGTWAVSHPGKRRWRGDKEQLVCAGCFLKKGKNVVTWRMRGIQAQEVSLECAWVKIDLTKLLGRFCPQ